MAKIITLGCAVADVHHRYSAAHNQLFGAASYRLVISALTGRTAATYGNLEQSLTGLETELQQLEEQIAAIDGQDDPLPRGADQLPLTLLEYTRTLRGVILDLATICGRLREDEKGYREISTSGHSRFNRDKIDYDHAISRLERLGTHLNRLFSTY